MTESVVATVAIMPMAMAKPSGQVEQRHEFEVHAEDSRDQVSPA
jgi:hypothetical protein